MNSQIFYKKLTGETIYIIDSQVLVKHVNKWKFNRPPDEERVKDLINYIKKNKRVDGIICIARLNNEFICYDGQTRLEALKYISTRIEVLVEYIEVNSHEELFDRFKNINKCVPVPDIYLENDNESTLEKTEWILNQLKHLFNGVQSIRNNPQRPNYNRDNLHNFLTDYIQNTGQFLTKEEIWSKIIQFNSNEKENSGEVSSKIIDKCNKTGCYLFARSKYSEFLKLI